MKAYTVTRTRTVVETKTVRVGDDAAQPASEALTHAISPQSGTWSPAAGTTEFDYTIVRAINHEGARP